MKRPLFGLSLAALSFSATLQAACPAMFQVREAIEHQGLLSAPFISVYRDPSYNPKVWVAITEPLHIIDGDLTLMISDIHAKTQAEARSQAEQLFYNNTAGYAFGSVDRDGHTFCAFSIAPPYLVTAQEPISAPADALYDDLS